MDIYINGVSLRTLIIRRLRAFRIFNQIFPLGTGGGAEYSIRVWLKHLNKIKYSGIPEVVAELGPGSTLGAGIAALLSGAKHYYAFDVQNYISNEKLLVEFDEIVEIFKKGTLPELNCLNEIYNVENISEFLSETRIIEIRNDISNYGANGNFIKYFAPWNSDALIESATVDFIFSQCVLEHVEDLEIGYSTIHKWLKKDGFTSHLIDFQCHSFTKHWNGHWAYSAKQWEFIKGTKAWAINRIPLSEHMEMIYNAGFEVIEAFKRNSEITGLSRSELAHEFTFLTDEDLKTTSLDVLLKKTGQ
ncbi:MAG: hypothetical protein ISR56_10910 [Bacteroidales bacterium]|nr:hypothetical protein [Bacteroidales bacterium]